MIPELGADTIIQYPASNPDDFGRGKLVAFQAVKSTRGKDRLWQAGVRVSGQTGELLTAFGSVGGKMQVTSRSFSTNQSGRNIGEQAVIELNSAYNKKLLSKEFTIGEESSEVPPVIRPMLAAEYAKSKNQIFPAFATPKLDGVRCLAEVLRLDSGEFIRLSSRNREGLYNRFAHLFAPELRGLISFIASYLNTSINEVVIDGELVSVKKNGQIDFQLTTSIARRVTSEVTPAEEASLRFVVFTFYSRSHPLLPNGDRFAMLNAAFARVKSALTKRALAPKVQMIPDITPVASDAEVRAAHAKYVAAGYEGTVIYTADGPYEPGRRSPYLLKLKDQDSSEGVVVGVRPGKGRERDAALFDVDIGGRVVTMHPTGELEGRREILRDPSLIVGKVVTYMHQGVTDADIPRFPRVIGVRDYE